MTRERCTVAHERIVHLMDAIEDIADKPEPDRFGRTAEELDLHFGSLITGGSPTILVELQLKNRVTLRMRASSNHAHSLPWKVEGINRHENFNPEVSIAVASLMPEGFMFKEWLRSADSILGSEKDARAKLDWLKGESDDQPQETYEQQMARFNAAFKKLSDTMAHGEDVEFSKEKRDYTANQLRRLSASELSELTAEGFDLSTSDETGQTALMLAAFPPFSHDQFEILVAAGADVNAQRADSMTGLMLACAGGMTDTVSFWLNAGAKVNLTGQNGCTAIMLGTSYPMILQRLLESGADVTATDNDGDSALDYAIHDQSIMHAGRRLESIDILVREIGRVDISSLKRSLEHAVEVARKTRIHRHVLMKLGMRPLSENIRTARQKADQDEFLKTWLADTEEIIDLEISETELADRIVGILQKAVAEADQ